MNMLNVQPESLLVYGHVGFDVSTRADRTFRTIGGAAYYVAMAARSVGGHVRLVSVLGSDLSEAAFEDIGFCGEVCSDQSSAEFRQSYDENEQVSNFEAHLNACSKLVPTMIGTSINNAGAIHLATAPPIQQALALEWIRKAEFDGIVSIDTAEFFVEDFRVLLQQSGGDLDYIFLNAAEFDALKLYLPETATVVVKMGSEGAKICSGRRWLNMPANNISTVFTVTGAGDVLAGTFIAKILEGVSQFEALSAAVQRATSFVESGIEFLVIASGHAPVPACSEEKACPN
jgi:sugar/nucleoside kinase (ribokinase family)